MILPCLCFSSVCKIVISLLISSLNRHFEDTGFILLNISKLFIFSTFLCSAYFKFGISFIFRYSLVMISMLFKAFQFSLFSLITLSSESFCHHAPFPPILHPCHATYIFSFFQQIWSQNKIKYIFYSLRFRPRFCS